MRKFNIADLTPQDAQVIAGRHADAVDVISPVNPQSYPRNRYKPFAHIRLNIGDVSLLRSRLELVLMNLAPDELVEVTQRPVPAGAETLLQEDLIPNNHGGLSFRGIPRNWVQNLLDPITGRPHVTLTNEAHRGVPLDCMIDFIETLAPSWKEPLRRCLNQIASGWNLEDGLDPALLRPRD